MEFNWDDGNRDHIRRHNVTPEDCETAMSNPVAIVPGISTDELRWKTTGVVGDRRLEIVWTIRDGQYRVVTAYWRSRK